MKNTNWTVWTNTKHECPFCGNTKNNKVEKVHPDDLFPVVDCTCHKCGKAFDDFE